MPDVHLSIRDGQAHLIFEALNYEVNTLTGDVLAEMDRIFDSLKDSTEIRCLFLESAKPHNFIAGVDIHDILDIQTQEDAQERLDRGHFVFDKLDALPIPTIALIQGACMGGGTEMALACDYRIAVDSPQTKIGLPEVKIGLFPGLGGTQRLPRLIGLTAALPIILSGEPVDARKALAIGLVDACLPEEDREKAADRFAAEILAGGDQKTGRRRRRKRSLFSRLMESNPLSRSLILRTAQKTVLKRTLGHYPAPLAAIRLIRDSIGKSLTRGLQMEREAFSRIALSQVSKNLIHIFFGIRKIRKPPDIRNAPDPREIGYAAVCGTGIMGPAIAWLFSAADIRVLLKSRSLDSAAGGMERVRNLYSRGVYKGRIGPEEAKRQMKLVSASDAVKDLAGRDIAVEAVAEDLVVKAEVLTEIEEALPEEAIIATCTSSFTIEELSANLVCPERFIGLHFLYPANRSALVEVIPGERTDSEVTVSVLHLIRRMKKIPMVVKDCPGFFINRILCRYLLESVALWQEGIPYPRIDQIMKSFGMAAGPFELLDKVGVDTGLKVAGHLEKTYGWNIPVPESVGKAMMENAWLGRKTGKGFYSRRGKTSLPNPDVESLGAEIGPRGDQDSEENIPTRLVGAMIVEAARCLEEDVVPSPLHVDMALILGTGFPPFRGGLFRYAEAVGISLMKYQLRTFEQSLGPRFSPPDYLRRLSDNRRFYSS
jgi:3-hydroxyacyl-CoA dehydrogenase/enoyl-CoA hydratase/3-hydroxybutyryl-CoA epimerase